MTKHTKKGAGGPRVAKTPKEPTETINFRLPISIKLKLKQLPQLSKRFREWVDEIIKIEL